MLFADIQLWLIFYSDTSLMTWIKMGMIEDPAWCWRWNNFFIREVQDNTEQVTHSAKKLHHDHSQLLKEIILRFNSFGIALLTMCISSAATTEFSTGSILDFSLVDPWVKSWQGQSTMGWLLIPLVDIQNSGPQNSGKWQREDLLD